MRWWLFFLILVIGFVFSSNRAVSDECLICEDMKGVLKPLHPSDGTLAWRDTLPTFTAALMERPKYMNVVLLKFDIHDVCNEKKVINLLATPKSYINQYETLMVGTQACTQACSISINKAEYCALDTALLFQINAWPGLSDAFADTTTLLDMAGEADRPAITQFSILLDGAAREAQGYLGQAMQNLVDNTAPVSDDPGFALARKELFEAGNVLQVLHWTGMAKPLARSRGKELTRLSRVLFNLNADLEIALGRAQVLEPKDRRSLARRIIVLAADIAVIRQSVAYSVRALRQSEPDTNANATNPLAETSLSLSAAGTCLNTLAIETSLIPEFGKGVKDELNLCRSFDGCSKITSFENTLDLQALIERIQANVGKDEKITMAVSQKICN